MLRQKKQLNLQLIYICWSRSSVSFHCFVAEFVNSIILRVLIGFYPKKYAIIYYKCEPRTVKRYLSITAINNSNIIWLK